MLASGNACHPGGDEPASGVDPRYPFPVSLGTFESMIFLKVGTLTCSL